MNDIHTRWLAIDALESIKKKTILSHRDIAIRLLAILSAFTLTACATKTIYVPAACPKPNIPAPPRDYMGELKPTSTPPEFVKACLATRLSGFQAYDSCRHILEGYK